MACHHRVKQDAILFRMWQRLKNIYHALVALMAATYYGYPAKKLTVIGVTGTDGKTTTTHLIHHVLKAAGKKASMVSSVYAEIAGKTFDTGFHVTTPDSWKLQKFLRLVADSGEQYMVLEVTSHGLDQYRTLGIHFDYGVITNITHEHLDYHKTYLNYVKAKEKLLLMAESAVINRDDESYRYFSSQVRKKVITYARNQDATITEKNFPFTTKLPGAYNRYNCLAAIAVCKQLGIADNEIRLAIKSFTGVKGRYEKIANDQNLNIIIDFAHTPHAFEEVLRQVKSETIRKVIHVFGSAALRDHSKRPLMGKNSARFADIIVLTEEDYRTENVNEIIDDIARGCEAEGAKVYSVDSYKEALKSKTPVFFRIPDRKMAIDFAIQKLAQPQDTVIITGKAHEKSLCRGTTEFPWSEHDAVQEALIGRKYANN